MKNKERGISIVDLMVVVAIVSVLSTLIVTQIATFAVRTENASAVADLRAAAAAQKSMQAAYQSYGRSSSMFSPMPGTGGWGMGGILVGPSSPDQNPTVLTTTDIAGTTRGWEIQLSNGVSFQAGNNAWGTTYVMQAKHLLGDTVFGMDADSGAIYMTKNGFFVGSPLGGGGIPVLPAATEGVVDFSAVWTAM